MGSTGVRGKRILAGSAVVALVGGALIASAAAGNSAPQTQVVSFAYSATAQSWVVPAGVTSIDVEIRGGEGGNGGKDATPAPDIGTFRGLVTGTVDVVPGSTLTVVPGQGGATGASTTNASTAAAVGGNNPLDGYNGGRGGNAGSRGSSGQGGAGGAASVLRIGDIDIVAGGGGGNGGSGQYAPTRGRAADSVFVARTVDPTSTDGQGGQNAADACAASTCNNDDGGGGGAGGGGAIGGKHGAIEFGAGTSNEWFGYGGSLGQNSTASQPGLTESVEYVASNSANGSIKISYTTGTASAPTAPQAVAGSGSAALSWTAPTSVGQGPLEGYAVRVTPVGGTAWTEPILTGSTDTVVTVPGLMNGTAYRFEVAAVTPAGIGTYSTLSNTVTPLAVPSAPRIEQLEARDGGLAVTFAAPESGAAATGYQYRVDGGSWVQLDATARPAVISGLTNGVSALIEIRATSAVGIGETSDPATATPRAVPGAPSVTSAAVEGGSAAIAFTEGFDGGTAITDYQVRVDGGSWASTGSTTSPVAVAGIAAGSHASIELRAVNAAGPGAASSPIIVSAPGVPAALVDAAAERRDGSIVVSWQLGSSGGAPITSVEYSLDEGARWESFSPSAPQSISGLENGTEQRILLRAVNAIGASEAVEVTAAPAGVPGAPAITRVRDTGTGELELAFAAPASNGGAPITAYDYTTDGGLTWRALGATESPAALTESSSGATLDADVEYTFVIRAVNEVGSGPASAGATRNGPVPVALPGAPVIDQVVSQPGAVQVDFTPADRGSVPVDYYEYSLDSGATWQRTPSLTPSFVITELADGVAVDVRVRAVNSQGEGAPSAAVSATPASAPSAPDLTRVARANGSLSVDFSLANDGGSTVTAIEASVDGGATWHGVEVVAGSFTISGLENGTAYTVQARAVNAAGTSSASNVLTAAPASAPPAPAATLVPGDGTVGVHAEFSGDGGAPLTAIEYSIDGGQTWIDTRSLSGDALITGLPNGTPVTVAVRAFNAIGAGDAATRTSTPRTVPGAPRNVSVVGGSATATVRWEAPEFDGGSPITDYTVTITSADGSAAQYRGIANTGPFTVTALTNGETYTVSVTATNAAGAGPASSPRPAVTPLARAAAPTIALAARGDGLLRLTLTAASGNGQTITGYEYTVDGGTTWQASPGIGTSKTISGLTNGTATSVQMRALTIAGAGAASNTVTATPYGYPKVPTGISVAPGTNSAVVSWQPADLNGNAISNYFATAFNAASGGATVQTCSATNTNCTISGLTNGTTYYVSLQTEATQTGVTDKLYSERSNPRVAVTPAAAGTAPTFGAVTRTANGFQVPITNFASIAQYAVTASGDVSGTVDASGLLTVTGVASGTPASVEVRVTRSGALDATATVQGTALDAGIAPVFGEVVRLADGFEAAITNLDAGATYTVTWPGSDASINARIDNGKLRVTGLQPGVSLEVTLGVAKSGATPASSRLTGTALDAGIAPTFGDPERTVDGFSAVISDFDAAARYDLELVGLPSSAAAMLDGDTIVVTGLAPDASATVPVTVHRDGAVAARADLSGRSLATGVAPTFGSVTRTDDGFSVDIENFDADAVYIVLPTVLSPQAEVILNGATLTVSGLDAGAQGSAVVTVSRAGSTDALATATGSALEAAPEVRFGPETRTVDGYVVTLEDLDPRVHYVVSFTDAPEGARVVFDAETGTVTVTGLPAGATATVLIEANQADHAVGSETFTASALSTGSAPQFGEVVRTIDGFTVEVTNFVDAGSYAFDTTALDAAVRVVRNGSVITVTGLQPGERLTVPVSVQLAGSTEATASVTGVALLAGISPEFGAAVRTPDGYTVEITNFDAAASYAVDDAQLPDGVHAALDGSQLSVTGLAAGEGAEIAVTVELSGSAPATASVTGAALLAGIAPEFGTAVRTPDGYTAQISNFDADAQYWVDAVEGVEGLSARLDGSLLIVSGLQAGATADVAVAVMRDDSTSASSTAQGRAQERGYAPILTTTQSLVDGFEFRIENYDESLEYTVAPAGIELGRAARVAANGANTPTAAAEAPPATAAATVPQLDRSGALVRVSGLEPSESATIVVSSFNADIAVATAEVTGSALPAEAGAGASAEADADADTEGGAGAGTDGSNDATGSGTAAGSGSDGGAGASGSGAGGSTGASGSAGGAGTGGLTATGGSGVMGGVALGALLLAAGAVLVVRRRRAH